MRGPKYQINRQCIGRPFSAADVDKLNRLRELNREVVKALKDTPTGLTRDRVLEDAVRMLRSTCSGISYQFTLTRKDVPYVLASLTVGRSYLTVDNLASLIYRYKNALRNARAEFRTRTVTTHRYLGVPVTKTNGVFNQPGLMLHVLKTANADRVYRDKRPYTDDRHVGIEVELVSRYSREFIASKVFEYKLQSHVTIKSDGSIRHEPGEYPHELCILASEKEYVSVLRRVGELFEDINARVNQSCGMHVHLDMRDRRPRKSFNNLVNAQGVLYGMQPETRRVNQFCVPTRTLRLPKTSTGSRYLGINGASFYKHKTIEVRMHSGTCNVDKIINWVSLLIAIVECKKILKPANTIKELIEANPKIRIPPGLAAYVSARASKFKPVELVYFTNYQAA